VGRGGSTLQSERSWVQIPPRRNLGHVLHSQLPVVLWRETLTQYPTIRAVLGASLNSIVDLKRIYRNRMKKILNTPSSLITPSPKTSPSIRPLPQMPFSPLYMCNTPLYLSLYFLFILSFHILPSSQFHLAVLPRSPSAKRQPSVNDSFHWWPYTFPYRMHRPSSPG